MKSILSILFFLSAFICQANMASPIWEGTSGGAAISSRNIDISSELIHVQIDKDFNTAAYHVEYHISADSSGRQIPLLFYARDFKDSFRVWVDGVRVELKPIPQQSNSIANTPFQGFSNSFKPMNEGEYGVIEIKWSDRKSDHYKLSDLKYFDADIAKGDHVIIVDYNAKAAVNRSQMVKEYSFDYSLSPAKYWRSFGNLTIVVETQNPEEKYTTNIGAATKDSAQTIKKWAFEKLPDDYFRIIYTPSVTGVAKLLINLGPFNLMILLAVVLLLLHVLAIYRFRKNNTAKWSWVVLVGGLIIPFLVLISYMGWDMVIDAAIGPEASRYHGYDFLMVMFYPFLMPVYWLAMWLTDYLMKRRMYGKLQMRNS